LPADARANLAIDTSSRTRAEHLIELAQKAEAEVVKMGLEISSAESWAICAEIASVWSKKRMSIDWVADAKIHDIPNTTAGIVRNLTELQHPPVGITIHAKSGLESMRAAQEVAGKRNIMMLAVTNLTSISPEETAETYNTNVRPLVLTLARNAARVGIQGLVCSAQEVEMIKEDSDTSHMFTMVPGTRSAGVSHNDQMRVTTPEEAISMGADMVVIGREVTESPTPIEAYHNIVTQIKNGLIYRGQR
jgi:orotidine-5'-phosphate decarboxylase